MKGTIRTLEKCSVCGGLFALALVGSDPDLICQKCKTRPRRYYVDLHYEGQRVRLYSDKMGRVFASYAHALRTLESIRAEIDSFTFDPKRYVKRDQASYRLSNYIASWLDSCSKAGLKPSSMHLKRWAAKKIVLHFGVMDIRNIKKRHCREFLEDIPLSQTRVSIKDQLQALLNFAYANEDIERQIIIDPITVERKPPIWLEPAQQEEILSHIPICERPIYRFIITYGCRPSEARALQWDCIDFNHELIIIRRNFSNRVLVEEPKESKWKALPMVNEIRTLLLELRKERNNLLVPFVFVTIRGTPYGDQLSDNWTKAARKAGYQGAKLYHNRHSFALQRLQAGYSYEEIGAILGHRNKTTTQRYARLQARKLKNVVEMKARHRQSTDSYFET